MGAFAAAVGALFADPNMGRDAIYTAGGAPVLVRVVARRADAVTDFADARLWSETTRVDLRVAEVPNPRPGDRIEIDGDAFLTPGEWERRTGLRLRFIYRRRGPSLLVAEGRLNTKGRAVASKSKTGRGVVTAPIFLLVPQVKLPKRLDLARDAERAHDAVPGLIVAKWAKGRF
ncbi:head-tail joining protein [Pseudogemmobacter bohemicus]|uniref:head-tail joining protein n=1 Tax=Pseudogemmobacter bohemicus TaxID=2250708 RepID=UPI000DD33481|nr:DUF6441 family protein [Pseudogemmobacter bohemicus]